MCCDKFIIRQLCCFMVLRECIYVRLDGLAYCTPMLYGIACTAYYCAEYHREL